LRYTDEALVAAAQLSYQYISDRFLPDKAIDLIDEAGSRVRLRHAQVRIAMGKLSWVSMIINHTVNLLYVKASWKD
jgi:ATP-dependent Clp protease ATP-binding subunit ClpA